MQNFGYASRELLFSSVEFNINGWKTRGERPLHFSK